MVDYINYGDLKIEKNVLMKELADRNRLYILSYVNSLPLSEKGKLKRAQAILSAYEDIINRGLVGASVGSNGQWGISVTNNPESYDEDIYGEAVNIITDIMKTLPTVTSQEEQEKLKKSNLPVFDNNTFIDNFKTHISSNDLGGQPFNIGGNDDRWNYLDERDSKTGIRGRENRIKALKKYLESYRDKFDASKFNFEGSPFENAEEFKNRLNNAINALNSPELTDDNDALNRLGLNPKDWFNNGTGDPYTGDPDFLGNYGEYYNEYLPKKRKAASLAIVDKRVAEIKKQQEALAPYKYSSLMYYSGQGKSLADLSKYGDNVLQQLNSYWRSPKLTPEQQEELIGAFKNAGATLENVSDEELKWLGNRYANSRGRIKKIKGLEGFYWDEVGQRVIHGIRQGLNDVLSFLDLVNANNPKIKQRIPISEEGWTSADTADVVSMIGDLVSLGGFWANVGGTATSLTSDLYADIARGKDLGSILKGVGVNLGWGLAGMLPGAKSTKLVARTARLIPKAIMTVLSAGIILDPEVLKSAMKFTTVDGLKTVSSKDLENLKYLFHAVTGGTNITRSHVRAKNYRELLNKQKVLTEKGTKKLSNKDVNEINEVGRKKGQKAAEEIFEKKTGQKTVEGQFKFSENGKSKFNPTRYSSTLSRMFSNDQQLKGEQTTDLRALSQILQKDRELPWYNWNKGYATFELTPFRSNPPINQKKKNKTIDESGPINPVITAESSNAKQPLVENPTIINGKHILNFKLKEPNYNRETAHQYREIMNNKFGNEPLLSGNYSLGDNNILIIKLSDGTFTILNNGKHISNERNQIEVLKIIRDLVKKFNTSKTGSTTKTSVKEMGKILRDLKAKGWLKQGGRIDRQKIQIYKNYIKK